MKRVMKYLYVPLCVMSILLMISSCDDEDGLEIQYPATGFYGDNILMKGKTEYTAWQNSLQAKLPEGQKLKIVITGKTVTLPTPNSLSGVWGMHSPNNWAISKFDRVAYTQTFQSIDGGLTCDLTIFFDKGTFQIDYYENDATSPTATKTIVVNY